jgi:hypothetical protein
MKSKIRATLAGGVLAVVGCAVFPVGIALADSCVGNCGTLGANGVVTLSPFGNPTYQFVTTSGGVTGAGEIPGVGGTDGSQFTTSPFSANAGDPLQFFFNYVTSDGSQFADYAWAELQTSLGTHVAWLFTARTQPTGNTSPGFGLPTNDSTLTPPTTAIIPPDQFGPRSVVLPELASMAPGRVVALPIGSNQISPLAALVPINSRSGSLTSSTRFLIRAWRSTALQSQGFQSRPFPAPSPVLDFPA